MVLMRPLSGSGTLGLFAELVKQYGPDSLVSRMGGTIFGSTETTFYVLAVYFGSVGVKRTRYALPAGIIADTAAGIASVIFCRMGFGLRAAQERHRHQVFGSDSVGTMKARLSGFCDRAAR
jgi:spore maturation protein B